MVTKPQARAWSDLPIPPGELLQEELDAIGMTQQELARRTDRPAQVINEIIRAKKRITHETALELEKVLGIPAHVWVNLEADYQLTEARLRDEEQLGRQEHWLQEFPVREMEKRGWIPTCPEKIDKVRELLRFLGVASFSAWEQTAIAFRITPRAKVSSGALAVWLRKGELDGREIDAAPYDESRFREALSTIRTFTREDPNVFVPRMIEMCAGAGVAVVFTQELPGSAAHGSARWLAQDKALIHLSLRGKKDGQLWFSFFHEACHVLWHRVREIHIDGIDGDSSPEAESDRFAEDSLIPADAWKYFSRVGTWSPATVQRFADQIGVAPGIIVGRLQHEKLIGWGSALNRLKVTLNWSED